MTSTSRLPHALHLVSAVGPIGGIAGFWSRLARPAHPLKMAALYWHFFDVVWVFLFPLLLSGALMTLRAATLAYLVLLALLAITVGSSFLPLGAGNPLVSPARPWRRQH